MAPNRDPQHVRLADHVCHGAMVDVEGGSLWGLSGMEVKPFPDPEVFPEAAQFVRNKIRTGFIEEASPEEYAEQVEAGKAIRRQHAMTLEERLRSDDADVQEGQTEVMVNALQRRILNRRRGQQVEPLESLGEDELARRQEEAKEAAEASQAEASKKSAGK